MVNDLGIDLDAVMNLPLEAQQELMRLLSLHQEATLLENSRSQFHDYIKRVWGTDEPFIDGAHIRHIAKIVDRMISGEGKRRIIINMPPRHMKSRMFSVMLPSYYLGKYPYRKIIQASNVSDLAIGFGRNVRDTIRSKTFQEIFPGVDIKADVNAAGRWNTNKQGEYYAVGAEGNVTGRGGHLIIIDDPHCLEIGTPIPTPRGFVAMKDLQIGDQVYAPDGSLTTIIDKSPEFERDLYSVTTQDGAEILCDEGHVWTVRTHASANSAFKSLTTGQLLNEYDWYQPPRLPYYDAVPYPEADLPIDPWVLGAWLGDGTSSNAKMTSHPDDQPYMRAQFEAAGYKTSDQVDKFNFGVLGLWTKLKACNLLDNKHIPAQYMTASIEQRLALLQGLIDTDGTVNSRGTTVFSNNDYDLAKSVEELVRSLGAKAKLWSRTSGSGFSASKPQTEYRVAFQLSNSARMPRKSHGKSTTKRGRSIQVEKTGFTGCVQCIKVDREDGLFLAGRGYVVTHNSDYQITNGFANPKVFDSTFDWFVGTLRQRLMPGGFIIICQTRFSKRDLTGRILEWAKNNGTLDEWEVVEFPAILPSGKNLWPEFWSMKDMEDARRDMPPSKWTSQYMQQPSVDEGAIIKKDTWRCWPNDFEPECNYVIQSWDTAFSAKESANYSACTTWGIFEHHNHKTGKAEKAAILLHSWRDRVEFPMLKKKAREFYLEHKPDTVLVEAKATGTPLIFELRQQDIPVSEFNPSRGSDKVTRVNAVSDLFSSGRIWYMPNVANEIVIDEFTDFPTGAYDDLVDSSTQALMRFRQGLFIETENDIHDDEEGRVVRDDWGYY